MLVTIQEVTIEINKMKRWYLFTVVVVYVETECALQESNYRRMFELGSLLQIHQKITLLHGGIITMELPRGLSKPSSRNGKRPVPFYGCMVNVRDCSTFFWYSLMPACL